MNLKTMNLPSATPARTQQQLTCRNTLRVLQPNAVYHAAQLADYGWDEVAEKLDAIEAFISHHKIKMSEKQLCTVLSLAISQRKRGENK